MEPLAPGSSQQPFLPPPLDPLPPFFLVMMVVPCRQLHHSAMTRASEDQLASLHGLLGTEIEMLIKSDDPRERIKGIELGLKFLKDNNITAVPDVAPSLSTIQSSIPSAEDLERLMLLTPN